MVKIAAFIVIIAILWIPIWKLVNWMSAKVNDNVNSEEERAKAVEREIEQLNDDIDKKKEELQSLLDKLEESKNKLSKGEK
jgi:F0F1-type ATP synthase membrane subunit b/b'